MVSVLVTSLLTIYFVTNIKGIPFAWHARFYYYVFKSLWLNKNKQISTKESQSSNDIFRPRVFKTHAPPIECDMYLHKSNSTYFSDLDIARTDFMCFILKKAYLYYNKKNGRYPFTPVAKVQISFKKEIKPFQRYTVNSRIVAWDDKWIFVLSKFMINDPKSVKRAIIQGDSKSIPAKTGNKVLDKYSTVAAVALTKYVLKNGRITIPPEEAFEICGLINDDVKKIGREQFKLIESNSSDYIETLDTFVEKDFVKGDLLA